MFEKNKPRYLTRGVHEAIPPELQIFMWNVIDRMPQPRDYLQVFRLTVEKGMQCVRHTSEQPHHDLTYILATEERPVTAKIFVIDSEDYCTMMLAEEY